MPRVTQGMLERGLGGADALLQLADRRRTGNINDPTCQSFIQEILDDGNAEVDGYVALAADISDPQLQTAPLLVRYELAVDCYLAWLRGAKGLAIPQKVTDEYERAMTELQKIAERKKGIGLRGGARASASQQVQQVVKKDSEPFFSPRGPRRRFDGWS